MTTDLRPVSVLFDEYLKAKYGGVAGVPVMSYAQLNFLCQKIGVLEARAVKLALEVTSQGKTSGYVKDNPTLLESRANAFETEILAEAFYYLASRLRGVIKRLPGFFECKGVRNVRNNLLEHPEGSASGAVHGVFAVGNKKTGPVIKMVRFPLENELWKDAGLWVNAEELAQNLTAKINAATAALGQVS